MPRLDSVHIGFAGDSALEQPPKLSQFNQHQLRVERGACKEHLDINRAQPTGPFYLREFPRWKQRACCGRSGVYKPPR